MFTRLLNQTMAIRSVSNTADALGGQSKSYTTLYTSKLCRINCLSIQQQVLLSRVGITVTHKFFCDNDINVTMGDQIVAEGNVFEVISMGDYNDRNSNPHHLSILARKFS